MQKAGRRLHQRLSQSLLPGLYRSQVNPSLASVVLAASALYIAGKPYPKQISALRRQRSKYEPCERCDWNARSQCLSFRSVCSFAGELLEHLGAL